jgi:hypothetical protein
VRCAALFALSFAVLAALPAAAQTQFLAGARGGLALPGATGLGPGPMAGVDGTFRFHRLVAIEATLEQSLHTRVVRDEPQDAWFTAWTLGVQYRLDVATVIPYALLGVEGWRESTAGRAVQSGYGAVFAFGFMAPLGRHLYWGGEGRYGIGVDGEFPTRQVYLLRLGWRSGAF